MSYQIEEQGVAHSVAADFRPLMRVLSKIQSERCRSLEEQREAFERYLLEYELNPSEYDWVETSRALGTAVAFSEVVAEREWTPGREDLTPLFDIEELAAS